MPITTPDHPSTADITDVTDAGPTSPPAAADKLRTALRTHPGSTSAELAVAAGIGRSTAAKLLARWAADNLVVRTTTPASGQPGRGPERWSLPNPVIPNPDTVDVSSDTGTDDGGGERAARGPEGEAKTVDNSSVILDAGLIADVAAAGATQPVDAASAAAQADAAGTPDDGQDDRSEPDAASRPDDIDPTEIPAPEPIPAAVGASRAQRLPAGGLRGLVEDYLREHPGAAFGPSQIGKDLSRSGGAVANALAKLVDAGCAVIVQDKPRRYRLAPGEATSTADANP